MRSRAQQQFSDEMVYWSKLLSVTHVQHLAGQQSKKMIIWVSLSPRSMIQSMWWFQRFNRRNMMLFNVPTQTEAPTLSTSKAMGPVFRQNSRISFVSPCSFMTITTLVAKPKKDRKVSCCIRTPCDLFWIVLSIQTIEGDDGYCLGFESGRCRSTVLKSRILAGRPRHPYGGLVTEFYEDLSVYTHITVRN